MVRLGMGSQWPAGVPAAPKATVKVAHLGMRPVAGRSGEGPAPGPSSYASCTKTPPRPRCRAEAGPAAYGPPPAARKPAQVEGSINIRITISSNPPNTAISAHGFAKGT